MSVTGTVLMVIGILAFIESLFALLLPKFAIKIMKSMKIMKSWQNVKTVKKVGLWEFVIAILIFIIGMNI